MASSRTQELEDDLLKAVGVRFFNLRTHPHVSGVGLGKVGSNEDQSSTYVVRVFVDVPKTSLFADIPKQVTLELDHHAVRTLPVVVEFTG